MTVKLSFPARIRRIALIAPLAAMLVLSACAGGGGQAGGAGGADSSFVLGQSAPINNLIPHPFTQSTMTWERALFDTLVTYDGGTITPSLAAHWNVDPASTRYQITLRDGVTFHDGKKLDAQTVADVLKWATDAKNNVSGGAVIGSGKVSVDSPTSLTVTFPTATPQFLYLLAVVPIVDLTSDINAHPNGTGPFKVDSFVANVSLKMARNDNYWNKNAMPKAKSFEVKVFSDNAAAQAALTSGQVQALAFPPYNQLSALEKAGDKIVTDKAPGNFMLRINTTSGPMADIRVRQALSLAIDRATFAKVGTAGRGTPTCSVYPPGSAVYQATFEANCNYDLQGAKALLAQAGYPNLSLTVDTSTVRQPELASYLPILQEQLKTIGVTLTINDISANLMSDRVLSGAYQVATDWYPWSNADPALLFISGSWAPGTRNLEKFTDPAYAPQVSAAQAEADPAKRMQLYRQLNEYLMDQSIVIPIATRPYVYVTGPKATGFAMDPLGMISPTALSAS